MQQLSLAKTTGTNNINEENLEKGFEKNIWYESRNNFIHLGQVVAQC